MLKKYLVIAAITILFLVIVGGIYLLNNSEKNETKDNGQGTIETKSFSFETVSSVKGGAVTTALINNIPANYEVKSITKNIISIEREGIQLLLLNPGIEAFTIYSLNSNDFINIGSNEFYSSDILRYSDYGEIDIREKNYLKYDNNYFYLHKSSKEEASCLNQFGCPTLALTPSQYNLYVYCSVEDTKFATQCDELLLDLKFKIQ